MTHDISIINLQIDKLMGKLLDDKISIFDRIVIRLKIEELQRKLQQLKLVEINKLSGVKKPTM